MFQMLKVAGAFTHDFLRPQMNNMTCIVSKYNTKGQYCIIIGWIFINKQFQYWSNTKYTKYNLNYDKSINTKTILNKLVVNFHQISQE